MTIDDDVFALLQQTARRERRSMREVVNDLLRRGLVHQRPDVPFEVKAHHSALQPGIDPHRLNQLADELEDEALMARLRR